MSLLLALVLAAAPDYPKQQGVVNDFAGILDPEARAKVGERLSGLLAAKNFVLILVTVKSLDERPIEEYTVGLANAWKIGEKGKNNGIVLLVAPHEHKVRIENGYGTETTLTDIESKLLIEEKMVPLFKEGKLAQGVLAGADALVERLGGTAPVPARAPPGGGGTTTGVLVFVIILIVIICILMSFEGGRWFLMAILDSATSSSSSSSGSSSSSDSDSGDSGSSGGSFGGGGASGSW